MTDSGRLRTAASPLIRTMLLEPPPDGRPAWKDELDRMTLVDLAHVVMLAERRIAGPGTAAALLTAIVDLRARDFVPLESRPMPRGLYLAYEGYLIELLGEDVGGVLQTGRSRNDLKATCFQLALRTPYSRLAHALGDLGIVLLNRARRYGRTLMPAYTHFQPAVPITFGHYLLGLAGALERDLAALLYAAATVDRCPLGAGAVGGTTIPIDSCRTADLLGFADPVRNSVDAVATRDAALRLLAASAILGVTLDRGALDLLTWSSTEFGLVTIPDGLVGSSSMMPQKRNPFVLEHVQGRSAAALGAFVTAAGAMRGTPFTNSIAVGTEAVAGVPAALDATADAVTIMRLAYAGLRPNPRAMAARAIEGLTGATATAEWLARQGTPFRRAHYEVGAASRAVLDGQADSLAAAIDGAGRGTVPDLRPAAVWPAMRFGGGPGDSASGPGFDRLARQWLSHRTALAAHKRRWSAARERLCGAVAEIVGAAAPDPIAAAGEAARQAVREAAGEADREAGARHGKERAHG